jgi:hypothetical protein
MASEFLWSLPHPDERVSPPMDISERGHSPPENYDDIFDIFDTKETSASFQRFDTFHSPFTPFLDDDDASDAFRSVS